MHPSDHALRLDNQLCFALYRASRTLVRAYTPFLEPLGLTYPQYLVMLVLWEDDDITSDALGDRLALDSGTLTPLLKRLEIQGPIVRHRDETGEGIVRVRLTEVGKNLKFRAREVPIAIACSAGIDITSADAVARVHQLRENLCVLHTDIEENAQKAE